MTTTAKLNLIAQWAFDTRSVLSRFHLWLEDVEVETDKGDEKNAFGFVPRGIGRCLAMTTGVTALGTQLFGHYGEAANVDSQKRNQVKKSADAISAYVMSEGLWHLTRNLPENHAIMVCLGEGLMPKAGESAEMGANPLLGFGRVYGRPEVAKFIDRQVHRLLNEPEPQWDDFYEAIRNRGLTIWGAAVDTLENTSRFALGKKTGPLSVFHLFDQPLTLTRPYESYMGSLTVPRAARKAAEDHTVLLDFLTERSKVLDAIEIAYPDVKRKNVHVWTLGGQSRAYRLGALWNEWSSLGVHLVEDGWQTPFHMGAFTDSGTYAPTFMVGSWKDDDGETHVFLCDGYAATAEAMQAASLSEVLDVDVSMAPYSPKFALPMADEYRLMKLSADDPDFRSKLAEIFAETKVDEEVIGFYKNAIQDAATANVPIQNRVLHADDLFPEKRWRVLATAGHMLPDPYTGIPGVTQVDDDIYRVTTRVATKQCSTKVTFTFRLMEPKAQSRLVFSPLLVRFTSGADYENRPVKVSDSGRLRNELQTIMSLALEYRRDKILVHFDRLDDKVIARKEQLAIRRVLEWYKANHPVWFEWLEIP